MSEYRQPDPGAYPLSAAGPAIGAYDGQAVPRTQPNVYHPQAPDAVPAYDAYTDPAAAHGWQSAYDETARLPQVADGAPAGRAAARGVRRAAARRDRRLLFAGGAVGALSIAALVAGLSFSGSSGDAPAGRGDRTVPTAEDAPDAVDPSGATGPADAEGSAGSGDSGAPQDTAAPGSQATGPSAGASPADSADTADSAGSSADPVTQDPTPGGQPSASTAPTAGASAPEASPTATDVKPGRGQGRPKGPKG